MPPRPPFSFLAWPSRLTKTKGEKLRILSGTSYRYNRHGAIFPGREVAVDRHCSFQIISFASIYLRRKKLSRTKQLKHLALTLAAPFPNFSTTSKFLSSSSSTSAMATNADSDSPPSDGDANSGEYRRDDDDDDDDNDDENDDDDGTVLDVGSRT